MTTLLLLVLWEMPNNIFIFPSSTLILSHHITNCRDSQAQFPFSSFIMMLLVYFLTNILQILFKNLLFIFWFHSFASCSRLHNVQDSSSSNSFHKISFLCPLLMTYICAIALSSRSTSLSINLFSHPIRTFDILLRSSANCNSYVRLRLPIWFQSCFHWSSHTISTFIFLFLWCLALFVFLSHFLKFFFLIFPHCN